MRKKLLIEDHGKLTAWIWNGRTEGRLLLGRESSALENGERVSRDGAVYWLEPATEEEELCEPALQMKLRGDALIPSGTEKQLTRMAERKRSELAEIEAALALLVKSRNGGKGRK
jgi:hypothetical protein